MKTKLLTLLTILSFIAKAGHRPLSPEFELQKTRPYLTFIENKGQVHDQFGKARTDVLFSGKASALVYHLRTDGISYQLNRIDTWKDEEIKRGKKIQVEDNVTVYRVDLNWMNCRTDFEILKDDALPGYTNYYYGKEVMLRVNTYVGVTCKNIYNNIDLHYYEKDGT